MTRRDRAQREANEVAWGEAAGGRIERAGYLAAILAGRRSPYMEDGTMDPEARRAIAEAADRIAERRTEEVGDLIRQLGGVTGEAAEKLPADYARKERLRLLAAIETANAKARADLEKATAPLARDARRRGIEGTPLSAADLAEASLIVAQYGQATRQERQHVAADAAVALEAGAVALARRLHRAAIGLGVADDATGRALDQADPAKRVAMEDLGIIGSLADSLERQLTRELADAGIGGASTSIRAEVGDWMARREAELPASGAPAPAPSPVPAGAAGGE
ncbi:MAG: hypothetical protein ABI841_02890 [Chloroflexota bacterium]